MHYELLRNGSHLNPVTANRGSSGAPLGEDQLRAFTLWRDELVGLAAAYRERLQVAAGAAPPGI